MQNQKPRTGCTSKYKGVRWQKHSKKFRAGIRHNGKIYDLGYFKDEIKAAKAYDKIAKKLFAEQNVTVVPGSYLSRLSNGINPGQQHLRIALVAPLNECIDAAQRIKTTAQSF